jgi:hypothetical protein
MQTPRWLTEALHAANFAYPVAFFGDHDPDLGMHLIAHAFDVPEADCVAVSLALTKLVRSCQEARDPLVLAGAFDEVESAEMRKRLPAAVAWWMPSGWPVFSRASAAIESALVEAAFPYRVAVFPNHLPELGDLVEVHAFDVPEASLLEVSQDLNARLAALRMHPIAIGMAFHQSESKITAERVSAEAVWVSPRY